MPQPAHRGPLGSFVVVGLSTFLLGGCVWLYADLRAFDPITASAVVSSVGIWATFGWMPSLAVAGALSGAEVMLGRHPPIQRRYGSLLGVASLVLLGLWLVGMDVSFGIDDLGIDPAGISKQIRREGEAIGPGGVGEFINGYVAPRSQYVALKTLEKRRSGLREGGQWVPADLAAMEAASVKNLDSDHRWLRELSRETLIWARLERLEPGGVAELMSEKLVPDEDLAAWLVDWERPGRPPVEGRMNAADHAAVQAWAATHLPDGQAALKWSIEQMGPGAVHSLFSQPLPPAVIDTILRSWCTTEGWSPLQAHQKRSAADRAAVNLAIATLGRAGDPLLRRQADVYRKWVAKYSPKGAR